MQGKITKTSVDRLEPWSVLWDTDVKGFGVRRHGADARHYLLRLPALEQWCVGRSELTGVCAVALHACADDAQFVHNMDNCTTLCCAQNMQVFHDRVHVSNLDTVTTSEGFDGFDQITLLLRRAVLLKWGFDPGKELMSDGSQA